MIDACKASIVRIFSHSGKSVIGAGFLVSETHLFSCTHIVAQALGIPENTSEAPIDAIYLDFPCVAPGALLTARVLLWRPTHEENITVLELTSPPPQTVHPVDVLVAEDVWQHSFQIFGFPRRQKEGKWATGTFQEEQASGWIPLKASKASPAPISSGFSGTPVWDEQERAVVGMVIVPQEPSGTRGAFAIPTIKLLRAWPELRQPLLQALHVYLEALTSRLARLPDYFPPHLDIDRMHQPIRVRWNPPPLRPEVAHAREAARQAGYFDEGERVFHWQGPYMYEQPKEQYGGGALDAGKIRRGTPMSWHRFRRSIRRAIILGDPGCGKSWLLQYEGYQVAREQLAELQRGEHLPDTLLLPIYLPLPLVAKELASSGTSDLPEAIGRMLQHAYTLSEQGVAWFKQHLVGPRCLLLLDALDEVAPEQRAQLLASLRHFAQQTRCRILLTCRTAGYLETPFPLRGNRDKFEFEFEVRQNRHECTFEVMPFKRKQVTDFIERWFVADLPRGRRLLERLYQEPTLRAFSRIPLQLALLCLLASEDEDLPVRRVQLYEAAQSLLPPRAHLLYPPFYAYLAARSLADQPVEQWREQVLAHCWFDPAWEGVIELLAGCLKDPNPLLEALLNEPYDVFHTMLLLAGRCLVEAEQGYVKQELKASIIARLIAVMRSLSARDRRQAALVLGQLGEAAVLQLLAVLKDQHEQIEARCAAAEALGISGSTSMLEDLLAIVRDEEDYREVRAMATWALGQLGDARKEEPLLAALQDKFWEVRAAAEALWHASTPQTIAALLAVLQDEHAEFGLYPSPKSCEVPGAIEALRHIGEPVIQVLMQDLSSRNSRVRWQAIHVIGQLGNPKAIQALQGILRDKNERTKIRVTTAWALGEIGDGQSVETLVKTARDASEHEAIRLQALGVLGDIGDGQVVEEILPLLHDRASEVRRGAIIALRGLGHARAVAGLVRALQDRREPVREEAAWALGWLGDARAVPALLLALQRERQWVFTWHAAWALGQIGDARATGGLLQALRGEALRFMTREAAAEALSHIHSAHEATEAMLVAPWYRQEWELGEQAVETLGRIGGPRSIETLLTIIRDQLQPRHLRRAAILALRHTCVPQTTEELLSVLQAIHWDEQSDEPMLLTEHFADMRVADNLTQSQNLVKGLWNRHHNERLQAAARFWNLAEQAQMAETMEHLLMSSWSENQMLFRAACKALQQRIHCIDPAEFCDQLLHTCSLYQPDDEVQADLYELLAQIGPRLYQEEPGAWSSWRVRLLPFTEQVLRRG